MKAESIREEFKRYGCLVCKYDNENQVQCESCFSYSKLELNRAVEKQLTELERLAEIGRYTEMAFEEEAIISLPDKTPVNCTTGVIGGIDLESIDKLIQWGRAHEDGGE